MADIFISYSRQDANRVKPLVELFERQGWTVWWDRDINPGQNFDELIDQEIDAARVVVVVWSRHSVSSRWVRNEALEAADRGILVPTRLDDSKTPVAFRQVQVADLTRWPARSDPVELDHLLGAVAEKLGAPLHPSGFSLPVANSRDARRWGTGGLAALMLIMLGGIAWYTLLEPAENSAPQDPALAVMRLKPASRSEVETFIADSLSDEIRNSLEQVAGLKVTNQVAAWEIPQQLSRAEVAGRLGARFLLQGSVTENAAGFDVDIQLLDAENDTTLFARSLKGDESRIADVQRQIAAATLDALGIDPSTLNVDRDSSRQDVDPAAYDLYLRAKDAMRRSVAVGKLTEARDLLIQATQRDPGFGSAYAALCRINLAIHESGGASNSFANAEAACHRALTLNSWDAEVYLALGDLYEQSGQYGKAEEAYERALAIDPQLADALMGLGTALAKDGKGDRAEHAFRRAVRLQPGYWRAHNSLGWFYMQSGRILEAIDAYTRVTYLAPANAWGFNNLGSARFASGDFDAAIRVWKRAGELDPESGVLSNMGTAYFYLRDFASAAEMYREALKYAPGDYRLWINLGDALRFVENSTASSEGVAGPAGATLTPQSVYRRAINLASAVQSVTPNDTSAISAQALAFAFLGERGQAESMISRAASVESGDAQTLYQLTLTYLLLDKTQDALAWLARAVEAGYPKVYVRSDPLFDPLRGVTEFDALAQDGS